MPPKHNFVFHKPLLAFSSRTGMHGVQSTVQSRSTLSRVLWLLCLMTALGIFTWKVVEIVNKYFSYPTSMEVSVNYESPKFFPAVTFCNLNPIKLNAVRELVKTSSMENMTKYINETLNYDPRLHFLKGKNWKVGKQYSRRNDYRKKDRLLMALSAMDDQIHEKLTYHLEDILIDCSFRGRNCFPNSFVHIENPRYGSCFIFNSKNRLPHVRNGGRENGVELTLFVDKDNYLPNMTEGTGYIFLVHDQAEPPMPDQNGLFVRPGALTSFGLKSTVLQRAARPYGNCTSADSRSKKLNMFASILNNTKYTMDVCMKTCEQYETIRLCNCYLVTHAYSRSCAFAELDNESCNKPCDFTENSTFRCHIYWRQNITRRCLRHTCQYHECVTKRFAITLSTASWPSEHSTLEIDHFLKRTNRSLENNLTSSNVLKVSIYFEDLNVVRFLTKPSFTEIDLVSSIGGNAGLFLGMSVFTVIEIIIFLKDLIQVLILLAKEKFKINPIL